MLIAIGDYGLGVLVRKAQDDADLRKWRRIDADFGIGAEIMDQVIDNHGLFLAGGIRALIDHLADFFGPIVVVEALLAKTAGIVAFQAGAGDNLFTGPIGQHFDIVVGGHGQECGGEKTEGEFHSVPFNVIAHPTDLVVAWGTGLPARSASSESRRSTTVGWRRCLPKSATRLSTRPR